MSTEITTTGTKEADLEDKDTSRKPKKLTDSQLLDWYEDTFSGLVDDTTGALLAVAKDRWIASPVTDDAAGLLYSQAVKLGRAETGYLPTPNAIKSAIAGFKAGSGDWPVHPIPYRMTRVGDEIWVDGGQPREHDRTVWHITPDIIEELERPAQGVVFRRSRRTAPMPRPDLNVDWERSMADYVKLFPGFNETQVKLSWLWDAYCYAHPSEKIPIKNLSGPAGYGKSSVMDTDILLVDNALAVKGGNRGVRLREKCDDDDLASVAAQSYLAAFDNLSNVTEHSDLLTSFSTGGTLAKRQLYTDTEMASVTMLKPTILTAITLRGVGADLASRFIEITAEHKPPYNANWESWRDGLIHGILGGMLRYVQIMLTFEKTVPNPSVSTRVAAFSHWVYAYDKLTGEDLLTQYVASTKDSQLDNADASTAVLIMVDMAQEGVFTENDTWTMGDLLTAMKQRQLGNIDKYGGSLPNSPKGLGDSLTRNMDALLLYGIQIEKTGRKLHGRPTRRIVYTEPVDVAEPAMDTVPVTTASQSGWDI